MSVGALVNLDLCSRLRFGHDDQSDDNRDYDHDTDMQIHNEEDIFI